VIALCLMLQGKINSQIGFSLIVSQVNVVKNVNLSNHGKL